MSRNPSEPVTRAWIGLNRAFIQQLVWPDGEPDGRNGGQMSAR